MMKSEKPSIVFFGSGPVAAKSLHLLLNDFEVEAIVTKLTTESEMREISKSTPVFTVSDKKELDDLFAKKSFESSVGVLIDFGIIVSNKIIDAFPKGIINSHFSLLPELRGADPISFAILEGKQSTGVSLMLIVEAMDEGPLLGQSRLDIETDETTPTLTDKLIVLSSDMLKELLPLWLNGEIDAAPQEDVTIATSKEPTYTRKLKKTDGLIDWNKSAIQIDREVRAFSGWPKSKSNFGMVDCVVLKTSVILKSGKPGVLFIEGNKLGVFCGADALLIEKLKPAGKKEMDAAGFLNGYKDRLNL